jgi:hypothetical protein
MLQAFFQHLRLVALCCPQGGPPGMMVCLGTWATTLSGLTGEASVLWSSINTAQQTAAGLSRSQRMMRVEKARPCKILNTM